MKTVSAVEFYKKNPHIKKEHLRMRFLWGTESKIIFKEKEKEMPEKKTDEQLEGTNMIIRWILRILTAVALLIIAIVLNNYNNRITELEKRMEVIDVVDESIGAIKSAIKAIGDDTYTTDEVIKLRKELDNLIIRFNDYKIPIKKSKTKKKKR
jgi:hypothetical protein